MTGYLERLVLRNLRRLTEAEIVPAQGLTLIVGRNGQGKTTVLEGIHLLSTGRLLRAGTENDAIQLGQDGARVEGTLTGGTELAVTLKKGSRKIAYLNGLGQRRASDLIGRMPVVAFSAQDLSLVTGEPADRRMYLDLEISQVSPAYLRDLTVYKKNLKERNALLRQEEWVSDDLLATYEEAMAEAGAGMRQARAQWVAELAPLARDAYATLAPGESLHVEYLPHEEWMDAEGAREDYALNRRRDRERRMSTRGPHRDDMAIEVAGVDGRKYGSQGQQRTAVIAVKMATRALMAARRGEWPLLLLDDVFSDLDAQRRACLAEWASQPGGQVILTGTEPELAGSALISAQALYWVDSGVVTRDEIRG